jgi:hypothetical protein
MFAGVHTQEFMLNVLKTGPTGPSPAHSIICSRCGTKHEGDYMWIPPAEVWDLDDKWPLPLIQDSNAKLSYAASVLGLTGWNYATLNFLVVLFYFCCWNCYVELNYGSFGIMARVSYDPSANGHDCCSLLSQSTGLTIFIIHRAIWIAVSPIYIILLKFFTSSSRVMPTSRTLDQESPPTVEAYQDGVRLVACLHSHCMKRNN